VTEGMGQRLVPYNPANFNGQDINVEVMNECLFNSPEVPSKTPLYGFRFKGLNDKKLFFNEDQTRMAQTYRTVFMKLAFFYSNDSSKFAEAEKVLDRMETVIPRDVISMDYRIEYDVAMLYSKIGNQQKFKELSDNVMLRAEEEIKTNPSNVQSYYNPYRILLDIYEARAEYQKALDLLNRLSAMSPNDPSIMQKIESIKQKMSNPSGN